MPVKTESGWADRRGPSSVTSFEAVRTSQAFRLYIFDLGGVGTRVRRPSPLHPPRLLTSEFEAGYQSRALGTQRLGHPMFVRRTLGSGTIDVALEIGGGWQGVAPVSTDRGGGNRIVF